MNEVGGYTQRGREGAREGGFREEKEGREEKGWGTVWFRQTESDGIGCIWS